MASLEEFYPERIGEQSKNSVRVHDVLGRHDGEKFRLTVPCRDPERAVNVANV